MIAVDLGEVIGDKAPTGIAGGLRGQKVIGLRRRLEFGTQFLIELLLDRSRILLLRFGSRFRVPNAIPGMG